MDIKRYLSRGYWLERKINAKLDDVSRAKELATKCTQSFSDVPPSGSRDPHKNENVLVKIADYENEVKADIEELIEVQRDINTIVESMPTQDYGMLIRFRYINHYRWEEIAAEMRISLRSVYRMHSRALCEASIIGSKCHLCHPIDT